jgi:butyryl-CoA dehydrogenase
MLSLGLNFPQNMLITPAQDQIRAIARAFTAREIAPFAAQWDRECTVPVEVLRKLGALGFMGLCVEPSWGGAGLDLMSYVLAVEEIAAGDCGLCNLMCVNNSPNCAALQDYGTPAQKAHFLTPLASGTRHSAFLLTEPHAGSDAAAIRTRAVREGDHYVLNGTKQFVTGGRSANVALIVAVTDPAAGKRGLSCFLSPTDVPGYRVVCTERKLGHHAADTCQIALENLVIPAGNLLGPLHGGYKIALAYLENGRLGVAAQAVGVARAALSAALEYADQNALRRPQSIAFKLADMATAVEGARQITWHAAALKDAGRPCVREASMAKLYASTIAEKVCSNALQILGNDGCLENFPLEKLYRDARVLAIYEGTNEIQRMVIARNLRA